MNAQTFHEGNGKRQPQSDDNPGSSERPEAAKADPGEIAKAFLAKHSIDGLPRYRFWNGDWLYWSSGRYAKITEADLCGVVVKHFKCRWSHVKSRSRHQRHLAPTLRNNPIA